ncbi:MAG: hypothetical protein EXX96DRAFT_566403 [Benjaminiella poitrasii]|nr:MAG: hypothetical protein EXX96DRAFT_566403 [Benjaminiella poitrasii]
MKRISDNVFMLTTLSLAVVAWLITFIGACVFRRGLSGGSWWIIVYEFLLLATLVFVLINNTFTHYRFMLLTFLAASIAMVTYQLDYVLPASKFTLSYKSGASAYAVGYIILMITQFVWIIVFGSETESRLGKYSPSNYNGNSVGIIEGHSENGQQQYATTGDKTMVPDSSNMPFGTTTSTNSQMPYNNTANNTVSSHPATNVSVDPNNSAVGTSDAMAPQQPVVEYKEKVQSLHAYEANPEDPNELSFTKGEILEIVDRNGNWWQARKSDGKMGIIPSNYVSFVLLI